jgi:hypothetical protein
MNARDLRMLGGILAGAALLGGGAGAVRARSQDTSQQEDAVAAAARKAREEKKKEGTKAKKVYTDDDVSHLRGGVTSAAAEVPKVPGQEGEAKTAEGVPKEGAGAEGAGDKPKETPEQKWRKKFADAYKDLDRAERELDVLQRENNKAQTQYYSDPQKALKEQYTRNEINERDAKIAAKQKEVQQQKDRVSDLEDQMRKDGGDAGWASRP